VFGGERVRLDEILEENVPERYNLTEHLWSYLRDYAEKHRARGNGFGYGLIADPSVAVTRTLSARYYKDGSEILIATRGKTPRRLTPRECARLMGFPDWFKIPVSDTQAYKQFGNSVAVPVVRRIAEAMREVLLTRRSPDSYVRGRVRETLIHSSRNDHVNGSTEAQLPQEAPPVVRDEQASLPLA